MVDWKKVAVVGGVLAAIGYFIYKAKPAVALPEITDNRIEAPKYSLAVGEAVVVSGKLTFASPLPSDAEAKIDVVYDTTTVKTVTKKFAKDSTTGDYTFDISFPKEGTYQLYTDAKW
jgi:hypothetical protein